MKKLITLLLLTCSIASLFSQSVSTQSPVVPPNTPYVVNFSGFPGNKADWIAVAKADQKDDQSQVWYYTDGKTSGTMNIYGMAEGQYEVRGYFNNEYTVRCRYRFTIGFSDPNSAPKAVTEKTTYTDKEKIVVVYSNFPGNKADWIGVSLATNKDEQLGQWFYTEGNQSGTMTFSALAPGTYEVRGFFNNGYDVRSRYQFTVTAGSGSTTTTTTTTTTVKGTPATLCRRELSTFFAGIGGLGSAWGRAATEPTVMNPGAIADMQATIANAKAAIELVKCIPYDVKKIDAMSAKLPGLSNAQAVAEIETVIKEIQAAVGMVTLDCGTTLMSLYVSAIHMGAAQAWASSRMLQPAPMPSSIQTVIFNHLKTAQDAFGGFMPCLTGFPLTSITSTVNLNSSLSVEPHINVIMLQCNMIWSIALSDCCCYCK